MKETCFHNIWRGHALRTACGITLLGFLLLAGSAGAAPFAYIPVHGDESVSVIDTATNAVVTIVPLGTLPWGVAVSSDGAKIYVTNDEIGTVSIIDTCTKTVVTTVPLGWDSLPIGVAVNPAGTKVYVANNGHNTVSVIDTATNNVTTVNVGNGPWGVAVNPAGTMVYVTNWGSNTVSVIETASNTVKATVRVGVSPTGIAVTPDGTKVYVGNYGSHIISVIDTTKNIVTASVDAALDRLNPEGVAVNPAGTKVYVTNGGSSTVSVIDTAKNNVTATLNVEDSPVGVAVTPDGTKVYVGNRAPGDTPVSVINTATNAVSTITVGNAPIAFGQFMGVQPSCAPPRPVASFTATQTSLMPPLNVQFKDTSTNNPTSWSWNFGDTGTGWYCDCFLRCQYRIWRLQTYLAQNPAYTYRKAGSYTVSLTATNAAGSNTAKQTVTVNSVRCPNWQWLPLPLLKKY